MSPKLATAPSEDAQQDAIKRAIAHLLTEYQRARADREAATHRMARFAETARLLIHQLSLDEGALFQRRLADLEQGGSAPSRGGDAFGKVIALFERDRRPEWTISQIQQALGETVSDQKALYNAIAYLASSGRLRRISRGQYAVLQPGVGIEFEGKEDGTTRITEHDT